MRLLIFIGLIAACFVPAANATGLAAIEAKVEQIRENIENQIERMKLIRERSANEMAVARARIEGQVTRSQDSLAVQLESLERLREQLGEEVTGARRAVRQFQGNVRMSLDKSVSEIDNQIRETNALLREMEFVRRKIAQEQTKGEETCENPDISIEPVGGTPISPAPVSPDPSPSGDSSPNPGVGPSGDGTSGTTGASGDSPSPTPTGG